MLLLNKSFWEIGDWTISMGEALHNEWRTRFGHDTTKVHKSFEVIQYLKAHPPPKFNSDSKTRTEFALAMPDIYKVPGDAIKSYRDYYMSPEKQQLASWRSTFFQRI